MQATGVFLVRAVGLEPTLREERVFETLASTIPPRPRRGDVYERPGAMVNSDDRAFEKPSNRAGVRAWPIGRALAPFAPFCGLGP